MPVLAFGRPAPFRDLAVKRFRTDADFVGDGPPLAPRWQRAPAPTKPGVQSLGYGLQRKDFRVHSGDLEFVCKMPGPVVREIWAGPEIGAEFGHWIAAGMGFSHCGRIAMIALRTERRFRQDRACRSLLQNCAGPIALCPGQMDRAGETMSYAESPPATEVEQILTRCKHQLLRPQAVQMVDGQV